MNSLLSNGRAVALTLFVTIATQILYIATLSGVGIVEGWPLRSTIWTVETVAFTMMAVAAMAAMVEDQTRRVIWAMLAVSALFNALQAGIGLSMFLPATQAGEDFAPLMTTVLAGAFLFYFLAKVLIGMAGIGFGLSLWNGGGIAKALAVLAILTGLAATAVNILALPQGLALIQPAGATGTLATLFVALAIWASPSHTA
ncbi:MAG: hypothetical protein AAFX04_04840 [Pseudomonadota bacterium]